MALKFKRNVREMEEIPLSSTADIAFLLIVFFLSASALLELKGVKLPLPVKDAPPMQAAKKDLFKITVNAAGGYLFEKKELTLEELLQILKEKYSENGELIVYVRVDAQAPSSHIPLLIHSIQKMGIKRFTINMLEKSSSR